MGSCHPCHDSQNWEVAPIHSSVPAQATSAPEAGNSKAAAEDCQSSTEAKNRALPSRANRDCGFFTVQYSIQFCSVRFGFVLITLHLYLTRRIAPYDTAILLFRYSCPAVLCSGREAQVYSDGQNVPVLPGRCAPVAVRTDGSDAVLPGAVRFVFAAVFYVTAVITGGRVRLIVR